MKFEII